VGARVTRFDYMDRMDGDEIDESELRRAREEVWRASLPPVKPERVIDGMYGGKISMYTGEAELEMCRRDQQLGKIRRGEAR
jgi:hypothetical protein